MKFFAIVFLILIAFIFTPNPLSSAATFENWQTSPWVTKEPYMEKIINKLGFGLTNGLTGWTALFFEPCRANNFFTGLVKGSWRTITNTAGGALHIVTFPIPVDIPLPDGGVHFD
jgi:hypothetical protein